MKRERKNKKMENRAGAMLGQPANRLPLRLSLLLQAVSWVTGSSSLDPFSSANGQCHRISVTCCSTGYPIRLLAIPGRQQMCFDYSHPLAHHTHRDQLITDDPLPLQPYPSYPLRPPPFPCDKKQAVANPSPPYSVCRCTGPSHQRLVLLSLVAVSSGAICGEPYFLLTIRCHSSSLNLTS